jgi:hypothetical protein
MRRLLSWLNISIASAAIVGACSNYFFEFGTGRAMAYGLAIGMASAIIGILFKNRGGLGRTTTTESTRQKNDSMISNDTVN